MTRAAIQWKRDNDGDFTAIGVWFATRASLQSRVLPSWGMENWFRNIHEMARPPCLDDGETRGAWEGWVGFALDGLSNGHDLMVSEVRPETTLDRTYAKWVLGLSGEALDRWTPTKRATITLVPVVDRVVPEPQCSWTRAVPDGWR